MTRILKVHCVLCVALSIAFCVFFQVSKHDPAFRGLNPFGEDPYDAIGSFAVQFVLFLSVLSLLRAFRGYPDGPRKEQQAVLARGAMFVVLAVAITLVADLVAMVRHIAMWTGSAAGHELGWMTLGLLAIVVIEGWYLYGAVKTLGLQSGKHRWKRMTVVCTGAVAVLACYPERLRQYLFGELFTVLIGIAVLFIPVWIAGMCIVPEFLGTYTDSLDDVSSVYRELKGASTFLASVCDWSEKVSNWRWVRAVTGALNPRQHRWNLIVAAAMLIGGALLIAELREPGVLMPMRRLFLLMAVYLGLEMAGVGTGYALLSKPLRLFRVAPYVDGRPQSSC